MRFSAVMRQCEQYTRRSWEIFPMILYFEIKKNGKRGLLRPAVR